MKRTIFIVFLCFVVIFQALSQEKKWDTRGGEVDTTMAHQRHTWKLEDDFLRIVPVDLDTSFLNAHNYNPLYQKSISNNYLGNLGSASLSNIYFDREYNSEFIFFHPWEIYWSSPNDQLYYNTTTPYTNLYYVQAGDRKNQENKVEIVHSQNINPFWNVTFNYDLWTAIGQYQNQKTKNRTFDMSTSYLKRRYEGHLYLGWSKAEQRENAGVMDEDNIRNPTMNTGAGDFTKPLNVPMKFNTSVETSFETQNIVLNQKIAVDKGELITEDTTYTNNLFNREYFVYIGHTLTYGRYSKNYAEDNAPTTYLFDEQNNPDGIYKNLYRPNQDKVLDSINYKDVENILFIELLKSRVQKLKFASKFFMSYQLQEYSHLNPVWTTKQDTSYVLDETQVPPDTINVLVSTVPHIDTAYINSMQDNFSIGFWANTNFDSRMGLTIYGKYCLAGYKKNNIDFEVQGDYSIFGQQDTSFVTAKVSYSSEIPDYYYQNYFSTYFKWENNFKHQQETRFSFAFNKPKRNLRLGIDAATINNYMYYDLESLPTQDNSTINVFAFSLRKLFQFRNLCFDNKAVYQYTNSPSVLPLPELSYYGTVYYKNILFNKAFPFQLGVEVYYNTEFYAQKYNPALGVFHLQQDSKYGNYPIFSAYLNFMLERAKIFFLYEHMMFDDFLSRDFFASPHYPLQQKRFKFGVSWMFFD